MIQKRFMHPMVLDSGSEPAKQFISGIFFPQDFFDLFFVLFKYM